MQQNKRKAGILFLCSAIAFFIAAALAKQVALIGPGAGMMGVGIALLRKAKKASAENN